MSTSTGEDAMARSANASVPRASTGTTKPLSPLSDGKGDGEDVSRATPQAIAAAAASAQRQLQPPPPPVYAVPSDRGSALRQRRKHDVEADEIEDTPTKDPFQTVRRAVEQRKPAIEAAAGELRDKVSAKLKEERAKRIARLQALLGSDIALRDGLAECAPCDFCILFTNTEVTEKYLKPVVTCLAGARLHRAPSNGSVLAKPLYIASDVSSANASASRRCFTLEVASTGLTTAGTTVHVTVPAVIAREFYQMHIDAINHILVDAVDAPFESQESQLTAAQRQRLLYTVLEDLVHGEPAQVPPSAEVDLFPAHEDAQRDAMWESVQLASPGALLRPVSEDAVAKYFGDETMFYFAWMNHYQHFLAAVGVAGLVVTVVGSVGSYPISDNPLTAVYTLLILLGSVMCTKLWERRCQTLCMRYHLFQPQWKDEQRREFRGTPGTDPVTGAPCLFYPSWFRGFVLQPFSWLVITLFLLFTVFIMACSLNLDGIVSDDSPLFLPRLRQLSQPGELLDPATHSLLSKAPSVLYSVCLSVLSSTFTSLAGWLTGLENYQYRGDYIRALAEKRVVFEFLNSYGKLLYIAFMIRDMDALSTNLKTIFFAGVFTRLITGTVVPFVVTHRSRVVKKLWSRRWIAAAGKAENKKGAGDATRAATTTAELHGGHGGSASSALDEADEKLDSFELYTDYVEMAIQLGYILLFALACPLASFVALVSNVVEVRSDLFKMCYVVRRPVPRLGVQENAMWASVFRLFAFAAVVTNTFLFTFTSNRLARAAPLLYNFTEADPVKGTPAHMELAEGKGYLAVVYAVVIEHCLVLLAVFLFWRISSVPKAVRVYQQKKRYERVRGVSEAK